MRLADTRNTTYLGLLSVIVEARDDSLSPEILPNPLDRNFAFVEALGNELLAESSGESLDAELERSIVGALIQLLHFLGHQRLVNRFALGVGGVHWEDEVSVTSSRNG